MNPRAIVRAVDGDDVIVELVREEACRSCGSATLCFPSGQKRHMVRAYNRAQARVGDQVELKLEQGSVFGASVLSYGLLLFGLLGGLIGGYIFGTGADVWVATGGGLGLSFGGFGVWYLGRVAKARGWFRAVAVRKKNLI